MNTHSMSKGRGDMSRVEWDFPVDRDSLFSNHKNVYRKGLETRRAKLLKKVQPVAKFLWRDEKIVLVATGCSPASVLEQMLTGWIFVYLKRSIFLFTNRRILHIPTKGDFSYKNSVAQILYSDCKSVEVKGNRLVVTYQNGKKEKFLCIPRQEGKKVNTMLSTLPVTGIPGQRGERVHLCPRCTGELVKDRFACPGCHLQFKEVDEGRRMSLLYPGGGYFYTGHPLLGIGDAIVEITFLIFLLLSLYGAVKGVEGTGTQLIIFSVLLAIEKGISVFHSNHFIREFIPKDKEIKPVT